MEKKDVYRDMAKAQIKEWEAMIDVLKARGEKKTAEAKIEIMNAVEKLQSEKDALQKKLADMMSSGGDAWEHLKDTMEKAMAEMKNAIDKALAKFK